MPTENRAVCPVIIGNWTNAYGLVRALGEKRIPSLLAAPCWGTAGASRYLRGVFRLPTRTPDPESVEALLEFGRTRSRPMLLIPTSEDWVCAVRDRRDAFERYFDLPLPGNDVLNLVLSKTRMHAWCLEHGLRVPETSIFEPGDDWDAFLGSAECRLPIIVKPETKGVGDQALGFTTREFASVEALRAWGRRMGERGPTCRVLYQRIVPGPTRNLIAYHGYRARDGGIHAVGIRKVHLVPPKHGSTGAAHVEADEESAAALRALLDALGYEGFFDVEFKRHGETGELYFIEVNPRPGMPNYAGAAVGINFPWVAWRASAGWPIPRPRIVIRSHVTWLMLPMDWLSNFLFYHARGEGDPLLRWLAPLVCGRRVVETYLTLDDVWVFPAAVLDTLNRSIGRPIARRLRRLLGRPAGPEEPE